MILTLKNNFRKVLIVIHINYKLHGAAGGRERAGRRREK
jgi:hypothetical protein